MKRMRILPAAAACMLALAVLISGCGPKNGNGSAEDNGSVEGGAQFGTENGVQTVAQTFYIYDTVVNLKLYGDQAGQQHMDDIYAILEDLDLKLSRTKEGGEVYAINEAAGKEAVAVSDDTFEVVQMSVDNAAQTDGLFDPTIGPLVDLWNIGNGGESVPDEAAIKAAAALTDYKDIILDESAQTVMLAREGMMLDLGGIGKGYAADRIADYLREQGIESAMINLGGSSIIGLGTKPGGLEWNIGLQDPDKSRGTQLGTIKIADEVIDASGVYERFFMQDGVRYHHIIDPYTGYPSQDGLKSLTIMSKNATDAEFLSTGVFLMGLEDGLKYFQEERPDVEAFFITDDNLIYATPGIRERLNLTDTAYSFAD